MLLWILIFGGLLIMMGHAMRFSGTPLGSSECDRNFFVVDRLVPGGGIEPPRYQVPADFESAASASSAIPAWEGKVLRHSSITHALDPFQL